MQKKASGDLKDPAFPLYRVVTDDDQSHWIFARAYPVYDNEGNVASIAGIAEDITSRKDAEDQIHFMAMHDPLTQLFNRYAFEQELVDLINSNKEADEKHALLYIDLDEFKIVNDSCGHTTGDKMLVGLTSLLQQVIDGFGTLARLGGDEFGVLVKNTTLQDAGDLAQQIISEITEFRFIWQNQKFSVGASIGLVMIDELPLSKSDLLSAADMACYAAKDLGRNRIHVYSKDDADLVQRHGEMRWVNKINHALEENRFLLHRQSIVSLQPDNQDLKCYEYLLRLVDEDNNLIYPNSFLPAAERFELMPRIDRWVIENTFKYLQSYNQEIEKKSDNSCAFINLSGQVFTDDDLSEFIISKCRSFELEPKLICFEITETAAIRNLDKAGKFISKLHEHGFYFALDDFGTGMSSFSYLKTLPVDYLKIDGVFIKDLYNDPMNAAIVDAVTNIGHKANLKIIAEWIENKEVQKTLTDIGVDYGQGFAISKPAALPELSELTRDEKFS